MFFFSTLHRTTCLIPAKLAMLLKSNPSLISTAVNRFCDKDPRDLKLCRTFETFRPVDFVNYRVLFTKHLYGKLKYCQHKPVETKEGGWPALSSLVQTLEADGVKCVSDKKQVQERYLLGYKLTCAFEMFAKLTVAENAKSGGRLSFEKYIERLKNFG